MRKILLIAVIVFGALAINGQKTDSTAKEKPKVQTPVNDTAFSNLLARKYQLYAKFMEDKYTKKDWDFITQNLATVLNDAIKEWNERKKN